MAMPHRDVEKTSQKHALSEVLDEIIAENSHLIEQQDWDTYFSFGKVVADQYLTTVLLALSRADIRTQWRGGQFYWYLPDTESCSDRPSKVKPEPEPTLRTATLNPHTEQKGLDTLLTYLAEQRLV